MANSMPLERLQALDNVEKEIASCIQSAGKHTSYYVSNLDLIFLLYYRASSHGIEQG